jgi:hypothetical protein
VLLSVIAFFLFYCSKSQLTPTRENSLSLLRYFVATNDRFLYLEDEYLPTIRRFVAFGGDRHSVAENLEDEIVRRCFRKNAVALRRLLHHKIY